MKQPRLPGFLDGWVNWLIGFAAGCLAGRLYFGGLGGWLIRWVGPRLGRFSFLIPEQNRRRRPTLYLPSFLSLAAIPILSSTIALPASTAVPTRVQRNHIILRFIVLTRRLRYPTTKNENRQDT